MSNIHRDVPWQAMEGAHDLGGMSGFGAVRTADAERSHHEPWELRAQWLAFATCRGARPWLERIDPATYLATSYYARWLIAAEMAAVEYAVLTTEELADRRAEIEGGLEPPRVENAERVAAVERLIAAASPMEPATHPRFSVGDTVIPRRVYAPDVHHRCPRYVRGVPGVVESVCGVDRLAGYRQHTTIEPVYTVRFESVDVWGPRRGEPPYALHVDLWESYLEAR